MDLEVSQCRAAFDSWWPTVNMADEHKSAAWAAWGIVWVSRGEQVDIEQQRWDELNVKSENLRRAMIEALSRNTRAEAFQVLRNALRDADSAGDGNAD